MKKLSTFIVAIIIAANSFGAAVNWTCWDITAPGSTDFLSGGQVAYLFECTSDFDISSVTVNKEFTGAGSLHTAYVGALETGSIFEENLGKWDSGTQAYFYMVVFDASSAADSNNYKISAVGTTDKPFSTGNADLDLTDSIASASWNKVASVPEPTTVALVALGLAALGMKRKVA